MQQQMNPDMTKNFDDLKQHHIASLSVLHESGNILHKGLTEIGQFYNDHVAESFNSAMEAMKSMCTAKTPQEAMNVHKEWLQSTMKNSMDKGAQLSQKTASLAKDVAQPLQDFAKQTGEKVKKSAEKR